MCKLHTFTHMVKRRAGRDLYAFATPALRRTERLMPRDVYAKGRKAQERVGSCLHLPDMPSQDWAGPLPCSALISFDFLSARIRAVLLPASHLAINGDRSKHCGGVRRPRNIPYSSTQVINKQWSPIEKDTERRINVNTGHSGSVTLSHEHLDVAEVGDGVFLYVIWQPGSEPKAKLSTNINGSGFAATRRKVICFFPSFFLSERILKTSSQQTQQDGVSLVNINNHMGKNYLPSDNIEY